METVGVGGQLGLELEWEELLELALGVRLHDCSFTVDYISMKMILTSHHLHSQVAIEVSR